MAEDKPVILKIGDRKRTMEGRVLLVAGTFWAGPNAVVLNENDTCNGENTRTESVVQLPEFPKPVACTDKELTTYIQDNKIKHGQRVDLTGEALLGRRESDGKYAMLLKILDTLMTWYGAQNTNTELDKEGIDRQGRNYIPPDIEVGQMLYYMENIGNVAALLDPSAFPGGNRQSIWLSVGGFGAGWSGRPLGQAQDLSRRQPHELDKFNNLCAGCAVRLVPP